MIAIDFRNETFEGLKGKLTGARWRTYWAWYSHGPGSTREVAARADLSLLTFRPRTTELVQLGLIRVAAEQPDGYTGEGFYEVAPEADWESWRADQMKEQMDLF